MMSPGVVAPNNSWSESHRRTLSAASPVFFRLMAIITTGNQRHLKLLTAAVLHENRAHLFCFLVCPQQLQQHLECKRRLYLNTCERVRLPSSFRNFFLPKRKKVREPGKRVGINVQECFEPERRIVRSRQAWATALFPGQPGLYDSMPEVKPETNIRKHKTWVTQRSKLNSG